MTARVRTIYGPRVDAEWNKVLAIKNRILVDDPVAVGELDRGLKMLEAAIAAERKAA